MRGVTGASQKAEKIATTCDELGAQGDGVVCLSREAVSETAQLTGGEKTMGSVDMLRDLLEDVKHLLDGLEREDALGLMDRIKEESYGTNLDRRLFQIRAAIESFNYDLASDLIHKVLQADGITGGTA